MYYRTRSSLDRSTVTSLAGVESLVFIFPFSGVLTRDYQHQYCGSDKAHKLYEYFQDCGDHGVCRLPVEFRVRIRG